MASDYFQSCFIIPYFLYSAYNKERMELKAERGGAPCEGNSTRSCDLGPCPIDCEWSEWSLCDGSCGTGTQKRYIFQQAKHGGELCKGVTSKPCQLKSCLPIDCKWSNWSSCDASCGYGMEKRRILQPAEYDGKECEGYATRSCHLKPCDPGT